MTRTAQECRYCGRRATSGITDGECVNASACNRRRIKAGLRPLEPETECVWPPPQPPGRGGGVRGPSGAGRGGRRPAWSAEPESSRRSFADEVISATKHKQRTAAAAAEADEDYRDTIRDAVAAGFFPETVAAWAEISVNRVSQICRGTRK